MHLFLKTVCQYNYPSVGFFIDVFIKGFVQRSPESRVVLDERKLNAEHDVDQKSHYLLKERDACRGKFP